MGRKKPLCLHPNCVTRRAVLDNLETLSDGTMIAMVPLSSHSHNRHPVEIEATDDGLLVCTWTNTRKDTAEHRHHCKVV